MSQLRIIIMYYFFLLKEFLFVEESHIFECLRVLFSQFSCHTVFGLFKD